MKGQRVVKLHPNTFQGVRISIGELKIRTSMLAYMKSSHFVQFSPSRWLQRQRDGEFCQKNWLENAQNSTESKPLLTSSQVGVEIFEPV